jgi:hypothetical protein
LKVSNIPTLFRSPQESKENRMIWNYWVSRRGDPLQRCSALKMSITSTPFGSPQESKGEPDNLEPPGLPPEQFSRQCSALKVSIISTLFRSPQESRANRMIWSH